MVETLAACRVQAQIRLEHMPCAGTLAAPTRTAYCAAKTSRGAARALSRPSTCQAMSSELVAGLSSGPCPFLSVGGARCKRGQGWCHKLVLLVQGQFCGRNCRPVRDRRPERALACVVVCAYQNDETGSTGSLAGWSWWTKPPRRRWMCQSSLAVCWR